MLHSLWPDPLRSLSLSPHTPTVFPIFRFLPLVSVLPVFPQIRRRLRRCVWLVWPGGWVGVFFFFFLWLHVRRERRGRLVGERLVSRSERRNRDAKIGAGGGHLMLFSGEVPAWWSRPRRADGWCLRRGRDREREVRCEAGGVWLNVWRLVEELI